MPSRQPQVFPRNSSSRCPSPGQAFARSMHRSPSGFRRVAGAVGVCARKLGAFGGKDREREEGREKGVYALLSLNTASLAMSFLKLPAPPLPVLVAAADKDPFFVFAFVFVLWVCV